MEIDSLGGITWYLNYRILKSEEREGRGGRLLN